ISRRPSRRTFAERVPTMAARRASTESAAAPPARAERTPIRNAILRAAAALLIVAAAAARGDDPREQERARYLAEAEGALASGDAERAERAFDRAASMAHAADTELGLVRTYMQAGEYRRALAFVAHTAAAHGDESGGTALYAWLLYVGGQQAQAARLLREGEASFRNDRSLQHVGAVLASHRPLASGALLEPPLRLAPYGEPAPDAVATASGWLFDGGRHAIVPL